MMIFVTGGTGVLGRPVLRHLRDAGHAVKALCRSPANRERLEQLGAAPVEADLFDAGSLARAFHGCDAVLHLATRIPATSEMKKPGIWDENDRIRSDGTRAIVEAALCTDGLRTILYPGISLFYGDGGAGWIDATTARTEIAGPMQSTLDAEAEIARFDKTSPDRRGVVLRFGGFYGPASGDSRQTLAMARKGLAVQLAAPSAYRSAIWIDDAASAVMAALETAPSGIYDVVEDEPGTQAELVAALADAVGRKRLWTLPRWLLSLALPADLRKLLARSQRISNTRFRQATGWTPQIPNPKEGWRRMAAEAARMSREIAGSPADRGRSELRDSNTA